MFILYVYYMFILLLLWVDLTECQMETAYSMQTEILKKPLLCMCLRIASQNDYKDVKDAP